MPARDGTLLFYKHTRREDKEHGQSVTQKVECQIPCIEFPSGYKELVGLIEQRPARAHHPAQYRLPPDFKRPTPPQQNGGSNGQTKRKELKGMRPFSNAHDRKQIFEESGRPLDIVDNGAECAGGIVVALPIARAGITGDMTPTALQWVGRKSYECGFIPQRRVAEARRAPRRPPRTRRRSGGRRRP